MYLHTPGTNALKVPVQGSVWLALTRPMKLVICQIRTQAQKYFYAQWNKQKTKNNKQRFHSSIFLPPHPPPQRSSNWHNFSKTPTMLMRVWRRLVLCIVLHHHTCHIFYQWIIFNFQSVYCHHSSLFTCC